jgi:hypothetical protein
MPRDLPLAHRTLLVAFDLHYRIGDVFLPHVGMSNRGYGHPFRLAGSTA